MLHKNYKCILSVEKTTTALWSQGDWLQGDLIGGKLPVVK
jgi:hypothetical protein